MTGTTDLDSQRSVIWNVGAIATSRRPGALDLVRNPAGIGCNPRLVPTGPHRRRAGRQEYQEPHVDGGAIAQLFLYPPTVDISQSGVRRERHAYINRNARLDPDYAMAERQTISLAGRAINTMLAMSGKNDVLRVYFIAQRDGVDYNLAFIGPDFDVQKKEEIRTALHARALRLRLPTGQERTGLAQGPAGNAAGTMIGTVASVPPPRHSHAVTTGHATQAEGAGLRTDTEQKPPRPYGCTGSCRSSCMRKARSGAGRQGAAERCPRRARRHFRDEFLESGRAWRPNQRTFSSAGKRGSIATHR
ncbi:hypothetical protein SAMN02990966_00623 [Rhodospirillales bacterium URHD0017]|nr:hypothetical protein SAMN02990966_00623 [Rhodospirillales bacterium URHD0017]